MEQHARAYQELRASAIVELDSSSPFDQTADQLGSAQINDEFLLLDWPGQTSASVPLSKRPFAIRRGHCRIVGRSNQEEL